MREYGSNIILPSLDNLFSSEQERQDAKLEKIQILPLSELHPFEGHPFQVRDDEEMDKMVDSVKEYGVMTPAIVRPRWDGGYEIVAGHRRCHASQRAGVDTMPCIVRDMNDDTAIILMVDSNCQREHILPSEKAKAYQMKLEAIKRKGGRPLKINSGQLGQNLSQPYSVEKVADEAGESVKQVQRFIRLNKLTPDLMQLVDDGRLKTTPAVELSYLTPEEQEMLCRYTRPVHYAKGARVHSPLESCVGILLLRSGQLRAYLLSEDGRDVTLYRLFGGEVCILSASCVMDSVNIDLYIDAEEDTEAYCISAGVFRRLMQQNVHVRCYAYQMTAERFSDSMWTMQQVLFMSADRRLAIFLTDELAKTGGTDVRMTHDQIARYMGSAREVVSRMLKYFAQEGWVRLFRGGVQVLDRKKLQQLARGQ